MERVGRTSLALAPATSFLSLLAASYSRVVTSIKTGHAPDHTFGADVAFSDALERELIMRELHAR